MIAGSPCDQRGDGRGVEAEAGRPIEGWTRDIRSMAGPVRLRTLEAGGRGGEGPSTAGEIRGSPLGRDQPLLQDQDSEWPWRPVFGRASLRTRTRLFADPRSNATGPGMFHERKGPDLGRPSGGERLQFWRSFRQEGQL